MEKWLQAEFDPEDLSSAYVSLFASSGLNLHPPVLSPEIQTFSLLSLWHPTKSKGCVPLTLTGSHILSESVIVDSNRLK